MTTFCLPPTKGRHNYTTMIPRTTKTTSRTKTALKTVGGISFFAAAVLCFFNNVLLDLQCHNTVGRNRRLGKTAFIVQQQSVDRRNHELEEDKSLSSIVRQRGTTARVALVRPFVEKNADKLSQSFDLWLTACDAANTTKSGAKFDLILLYSQDAGTAQRVVNEIKSKLQHPKSGWAGCVGKLQVLSAHIPPEKDIYDLQAQNQRSDWVLGPNLLFLRAFRMIQNLGSYETMYMMESDSIPLKSLWLDKLHDEIEALRPFSMFGR